MVLLVPNNKNGLHITPDNTTKNDIRYFMLSFFQIYAKNKIK